MKRLTQALLCASFLSLAAGCPPDEMPKAPPKEKKSSNIKKIVSPVPPGKKVACADLVDAAKIGPYIEDEVTIKDDSHTEVEPTSLCRVMKAGDPPPPPAPSKKEPAENSILGVQPGDEYCSIYAYCSLPADEKAFERNCNNQGDRPSEDLGQFVCVHETQRAAKYAYTYRTIHKATKCTFKIMGGPSVVDEALVQKCTKAALETITLENIKNFKNFK